MMILQLDIKINLGFKKEVAEAVIGESTHDAHGFKFEFRTWKNSILFFYNFSSCFTAPVIQLIEFVKLHLTSGQYQMGIPYLLVWSVGLCRFITNKKSIGTYWPLWDIRIVACVQILFMFRKISHLLRFDLARVNLIKASIGVIPVPAAIKLTVVIFFI